ncbi:MAG: S1C family serine protease [Planctomycetota bacterium]|nr:S1C family serine protease [Planctomycetota bacterium]
MRCVLALLLFAAVAAANDLEPKLRKALVKIQVTSQSWDLAEPWKKRRVSTRQGRGVVIRPGIVLTLANLVTNQLQIEASVYGSARQYPARLKHVDTRLGLALVEITDPKLVESLEPLKLGAPVKLDDKFDIWQLNADNLLQRATATVVRASASSTRLTLRVNTTSGDSGNGQVAIRDGAVVGFLTGSVRRQEGTILSIETIQHYLGGFAEDGGYRGIPGPCIWILPLLRDDLRQYYGLTDKQHGIAIRRVMPGRSGDGILKPDDVLLKVDGYDIDDEGTFIHEVHGRLHTGYLFQGRRYAGDKIKVEVFRGGAKKELELELKSPSPSTMLIPQKAAGSRPQFLVTGGLVILELTKNYSARSAILGRYQERDGWDARGDRQRLVFVDHILRDPSNKGFESLRQRPVLTVNDQPIRAIADVAKALEVKREFHVFRFEGVESDYVVAAADLATINARIAQRYKVTRQRYLHGDEE